MDLISNNVEILWMSRYHYKKNSDLHIHKHLHYQIIYILEGSGRLFLDGAWVSIICPSLLFLSPNMEHGMEIQSGLKTIDIKFAATKQKTRNKLADLSGLTAISVINNIEELMEELLVIGTQKKSLYRERCHLILSVILYATLWSTSYVTHAASPFP